MDPIDRILDLLALSERLKRELRHSWLADGRRESVAEELDAPAGLLVAPDGRTYVTAGRQLLQVRRLGPVGPRRFV